MTTVMIKERLVRPLAELSVTLLCILCMVDIPFLDLAIQKTRSDEAKINRGITKSSPVPPTFHRVTLMCPCNMIIK